MDVSAYTLFAWGSALILIWAVLQNFQRTRCLKTWQKLLLTLTPAFFVAAILGPLSFISWVLLIKPGHPQAAGRWPALMGLVFAGLLYGSLIGLIPVDIYRWGYQPTGLLLAAVWLVILRRFRPMAAWAGLFGLILWGLNGAPSANVLDAVFDPVLPLLLSRHLFARRAGGPHAA
jgi:hypothetical protein